MNLIRPIALALLLLPGAADVSAGQNVSYSSLLEQPIQQPSETLIYGEHESQRIEVWPVSDAKTDVFFIHGGCWLSDYDVQHAYAFATALQQRGHQVYAIEYRRSGSTGGGWPMTFDDIRRGFERVSQQHQRQRPLIVSGHSAGGHLALLLGAEGNYQQDISAVIGLAAITDVSEYARGDNSCEQVTADFMGGTEAQKPAAYAAANPVNTASHPVTVLLQGDNDAIVDEHYAHKIKGAQSQIVSGAGHFDWLHPDTPAFQQLLNALQGAQQ